MITTAAPAESSILDAGILDFEVDWLASLALWVLKEEGSGLTFFFSEWEVQVDLKKMGNEFHLFVTAGPLGGIGKKKIGTIDRTWLTSGAEGSSKIIAEIMGRVDLLDEQTLTPDGLLLGETISDDGLFGIALTPAQSGQNTLSGLRARMLVIQWKHQANELLKTHH